MKSDLKLMEQKKLFASMEREQMTQTFRYIDQKIMSLSDLEREMNYQKEYDSIANLERWAYQFDYSFQKEMVLWVLGKLSELKVSWVLELKELDFHYKLMRIVPENIHHLTHLQRLDLSNNNLQFLPKSFSALTQLKSLKIQFNRFADFPEEICSLTGLQTLWLFANQLTNLPPSIQNLNLLEDLNMARMGLSNLPVEIKQLTYLKDLNLSSNRLTSLPVLSGSIENLFVAHNQLSALSNLQNNTSLKQLHAQGNPITELPLLSDALRYINLEGTKIAAEDVKKMHLASCFVGNPYVGIRTYAVDGDQSSHAFASLFAYFPLVHSQLKCSGINIICKPTSLFDCFQYSFAENYTSQRQALIDEYPECLNSKNSYFVFFSRVRRREDYAEYFDKDPQMMGFIFPYEGGRDFIYQNGRIKTENWEGAYHTLVQWLNQESIVKEALVHK